MRWSSIWALIVPTFFAASVHGVTILHDFNGAEGGDPFADVLLIGNTLFGTTSQGGLAGDGVVYRVETDGTDFQVLHDFGVLPGDGGFLLGGLVFDGTALYGTTSSTLFAIEPDGTDYRVINSSISSDAGLDLEGSTLYGLSTRPYRGAVFSVETDGSAFQLLHEFAPSDGGTPWGTPTISNGRLYGTTSSGGEGGWGTVFGVDLDGSNFEVLHAFDRVSGGRPGAGVAIADGRLYGTTLSGGPNHGGVVYAIDADGLDFEILHAFSGDDGASLGGGVTLVGTHLYGSTMSGGLYREGTLFSVRQDGSGFHTIHHFAGAPSDGATPLPLAGFSMSGNVLFGTSRGGGSQQAGTIYSFIIPEPFALSLIVIGLLAFFHCRRRFDL